MAKLINRGDTLLAKHLDGHARKIEWKGQRLHPITKQRLMLYECDRNTILRITQAYTGELPMGSENFYTEVGDEVEADAVSMYVDSFRREKFPVKEGVTNRHGAQMIALRKYNISTIKTPLQNFKEIVLKKAALLENKNKE